MVQVNRLAAILAAIVITASTFHVIGNGADSRDPHGSPALADVASVVHMGSTALARDLARI